MTPDDILLQTKDSFATESRISLEAPLLDIVQLLSDRQTTGEIVIHMTKGGIDGIKVLEKTHIAGVKGDAIRRILGFDAE